ncbi:LPS assembly lipoprotein LptE [Dokdonella sp.]|uniref:LPS-assembly lipoprotein LptE n=1 Tax=Dokdonella sp. TaxID=2291710 RepID=UPI003C616D4E
MKLHRHFLPAIFALLLTACGFHLREEAVLPSGMQRIAIEGADALSPLGRDLRKALVRAGAQMVEDGAGEPSVLRIGTNSFRTDVLTVGDNARANEYTLRYQVEFDVVSASGTALLPRQSVELSRIFTFDATQAIGIAAEQDVLSKELQREMVQTIMRRLEIIGQSTKS